VRVSATGDAGGAVDDELAGRAGTGTLSVAHSRANPVAITSCVRLSSAPWPANGDWYPGSSSPSASPERVVPPSPSPRVSTGRSEPLDVGRPQKVIPAGIRKALIARDRTCAFAGTCDRPPAWSDGHHIHHWADGGPTDLSNLVLLCRRHHQLIHHHGFRVEMADNSPVFFRPDGTVIEGGGRAPP